MSEDEKIVINVEIPKTMHTALRKRSIQLYFSTNKVAHHVRQLIQKDLEGVKVE